MPYKILLFYRYVEIDSPDDLVIEVKPIMEEIGLLGRLLVAKEGINGTVAGSFSCIDFFIKYMSSKHSFSKVDWKCTEVFESDETLPFPVLSVRVVPEIISVGQEGKILIDPRVEFDECSFGGLKGTGVHLSPKAFDDAINEHAGIVIDIRNDFEYKVGHFCNAIPVKTSTYSATWSALDNILESFPGDSRVATPIYMYCTGGIRCEKASAYLRAKGVEHVYQLEGGIHRYLEEFPNGGNFFGKNFVFDRRRTISPGDEKNINTVVGECVQCRASYDEYNSNIRCSVCRKLVLFCPECVKLNPYPGEYHCSKHKFLSTSYFSCLDHFKTDELKEQSQILKNIEMQSLSEGQRGKNKRRTLRKQQERIANKVRDRSGGLLETTKVTMHEQSV